MVSRTPIIRQANFANSIPHLVVLALFVGGGYWLSDAHGFAAGAVGFLLLRLLLRGIAREHRAGIALVRQQRFEEAIPRFLESFEFFQGRRWLDDYRALLMLSPSAGSYREMALANAGFCYAQIGDGTNAIKYYQECLDLFPDSGLASTGLKMLTAASHDDS